VHDDLNDPYEFGQPPAEPHDKGGKSLPKVSELMIRLREKYHRDFRNMPLGEVKETLTPEEWTEFHDAIKYPNGKQEVKK